MAGRFRGRRRIILLAAIVVTLSIGIVFASVPKIPHPPGTIQQAETHDIQGAGATYPGIYAVTLDNLPGGADFAIGVTVTNGMGSFCVERQAYYIAWSFNNQTQGGLSFDYANCVVNQQTASATLRFTPSVTDNWVVVAINTNPNDILVEFSPAA